MAVGDAQCFKVLSLSKKEKYRVPTLPLINYCCIHFLPGRQYASDVITATMKEMQESGTFNSLIEANGRENAKKNKFHDTLIRSELTSVCFCFTAQSQSPFPLSRCYKKETNKNTKSRYRKDATFSA